MATRTVRLDDEAESALQQFRDATGLPISEALKQGLSSLRQRVLQEAGLKALRHLSAARFLRPGWLRHRAVNGHAPRRGLLRSAGSSATILVDTGPLVALFDSARRGSTTDA